jgi:hypothetical protein
MFVWASIPEPYRHLGISGIFQETAVGGQGGSIAWALVLANMTMIM